MIAQAGTTGCVGKLRSMLLGGIYVRAVVDLSGRSFTMLAPPKRACPGLLYVYLLRLFFTLEVMIHGICDDFFQG